MLRPVKIVGSGKYLPKRKVSAKEIGARIGASEAWVMRHSGVQTRYFSDYKLETSTYMGAEAAKNAIKNANIDPNKIDLVISASGVAQQPIPCNAVFIQKHLNLEKNQVPCFDINSTCLSFVTALNVCSHLLKSGEYRYILLVASDIASVGINWKNKESACLFGDGACAVVLEADQEQKSGVLAHKMISLGQHSEICKIGGGLSKIHASHYKEENRDDFLFHMEGTRLFKISSQRLPQLINEVLAPFKKTITDIDFVIPHQASQPGLRIIQKKLKIENKRFGSIIEDYGNIIAASIPLTLHELYTQNKFTRGQELLIVGTSAGLSMGVMLLRF